MPRSFLAFLHPVRRLALVLWGLLALCLVLAGRPASAHPVDEANVYHYLWLEGRPGELSLQHATYYGGLVTPAAWSLMDTDRSGDLSEAEQLAYARSLAADLKVTVGGRPAEWTLVDQRFPGRESFITGVFPEAAVTLRLTTKLPAELGQGIRVEVHDQSLPHFTAVFPRPVLKGFNVAAGDLRQSEDGRTTTFRLAEEGTPLPEGEGAPLAGAGSALGSGGNAPGGRMPGLSLSGNSPGLNAPGSSTASNGPAPTAGAGNSPLDRSLGNAPLFPDKGAVLYSAPPKPAGELDHLKELLRKPLTPWLIFLGLSAALLAGMAHALSPGHGKTMVAAYLVGSRGTVSDAVILGLTVTLTHTGSVFILGLISLWLTSLVRLEVITHWLAVTSGALVAGMGFWLLQRGLLAYYGVKPLPGHSHGAGGHSHGGHSHGQAHEAASHGHTHNAHEHSHAGEHSHETASHVHASSLEPAHAHAGTGSGRKPPRDYPLDGAPAAEPAAGAAPERLSRWGVVSLGVASGIVPCPDALAILLAAVSLGHIGLGLGIITAFSVGMALVLVAIGVVMVTAKDAVARFSGDRPCVKALPIASGGVLFVLGLWLTVQSLVAAGVFKG